MGDEGEFVIGYALSEKKRSSFLRQSLVSRADKEGVHLFPVDLERPQHLQPRVHAILHKLSSPPWLDQLSEYAQTHPRVLIVDPPSSIALLHDRVLMQQAMEKLQNAATATSHGDEEAYMQVPTQCVLHGQEAEQVKLALLEPLRFPVIVKPLIANSHAMLLAFNAHSVAELEQPVVVQEFINHGGVLFKVYVAGENVICVRRKSHPDSNPDELQDAHEPQILDRASSNSSDDLELQGIELPPDKFILKAASCLRRELGLRLFNFDIIRDVKERQKYFIIDINYFPGYAKIPNYEDIMVKFFLSLKDEQARLH